LLLMIFRGIYPLPVSAVLLPHSPAPHPLRNNNTHD